MKRLTKEELKGIDSTEKTIKKWDEFLKKGMYNLGYTKEQCENIYPYKQGIPMYDGTYMPVDEVTGRAFFKMSAADKLAGILSTIVASPSGLLHTGAQNLRDVIEKLWEEYPEFFTACFPVRFDKVTEYDKDNLSEMVKDEIFKQFIKDCDIIYSRSGTIEGIRETEMSEEDKINIFVYRNIPDKYIHIAASGTSFLVYNRILADNYDLKMPASIFRSVISEVVGTSSTEYSRLRNFDEVYLQDYLVISLNPVDKFMCSTKQAFSSCMSIAKQNDTHGTSSTPAFGLPAMFDTDSVFLTFLTPGKHKNMYWESAEWNKVPSERDPEKAYKYIKMTCRALTYKGTAQDKYGYNSNRVREDLNLTKEDKIVFDRYFGSERLYIGRQYSASGEDFIWQTLISFLLGKIGISTSMKYSDDLARVDEMLTANSYHPMTAIDLFRGKMPKEKTPVMIDRFGFLRGFYYDNLSLNFSQKGRIVRGSDGPKNRMEPNSCPLDSDTFITIGSSRCGTGSASQTWCDCGLDMFKMLLGEQNYSTWNTNIKLCSECGKLITDTLPPYRVDDRGRKRYICSDCFTKLGYKRCESCGDLYKEDEASEHEMIDLSTELGLPKSLKLCKNKIHKMDPRASAMCIHCGNILPNYRYGITSTILLKNYGIEVPIGLCYECSRYAVLCAKCKRLHFLDREDSEPVLLVSGKRIICPDCIKSIRLKKGIKEQLDKMFKEGFSLDDFAPEDRRDPKNIVDLISKELQEKFNSLGRGEEISSTVNNKNMKDINKQIRSYIASHSDVVKVRESKRLLVPEKVARIENEEPPTELFDFEEELPTF